MQTLIKTGRTAYGIGLMAMGIHQLFYADFRPVFLPPWPSWRMHPQLAAYITGVALVCAALSIIVSKKGKVVAMALGVLFLVLIIFWHLPYLFFIQPNQIRHLGLWTDALKALALAGGAFVVAGSFLNNRPNESTLTTWTEKLIPLGPIFFSITMIAFGIDHFLYIDYVAVLVPAWIPGNIFWTYFAGVILISSGVCIIFKIKMKLVALMLSIAIFLWFVMLHIPRAIADPITGNGNEIVSSADALAFSGVALLLAFMSGYRKRGATSENA